MRHLSFSIVDKNGNPIKDAIVTVSDLTGKTCEEGLTPHFELHDNRFYDISVKVKGKEVYKDKFKFTPRILGLKEIIIEDEIDQEIVGYSEFKLTPSDTSISYVFEFTCNPQCAPATTLELTKDGTTIETKSFTAGKIVGSFTDLDQVTEYCITVLAPTAPIPVDAIRCSTTGSLACFPEDFTRSSDAVFQTTNKTGSGSTALDTFAQDRNKDYKLTISNVASAVEVVGPTKPSARSQDDIVLQWITNNVDWWREFCAKDNNWYWVHYPITLEEIGVVVEECTSDADCGENQKCENGVCVDVTAPPPVTPPDMPDPATWEPLVIDLRNQPSAGSRAFSADEVTWGIPLTVSWRRDGKQPCGTGPATVSPYRDSKIVEAEYVTSWWVEERDLATCRITEDSGQRGIAGHRVSPPDFNLIDGTGGRRIATTLQPPADVEEWNTIAGTIPIPPPVECPEGQELRDGECVPIEVEPEPEELIDICELRLYQHAYAGNQPFVILFSEDEDLASKVNADETYPFLPVGPNITSDDYRNPNADFEVLREKAISIQTGALTIYPDVVDIQNTGKFHQDAGFPDAGGYARNGFPLSTLRNTDAIFAGWTEGFEEQRRTCQNAVGTIRQKSGHPLIEKLKDIDIAGKEYLEVTYVKYRAAWTSIKEIEEVVEEDWIDIIQKPVDYRIGEEVEFKWINKLTFAEGDCEPSTNCFFMDDSNNLLGYKNLIGEIGEEQTITIRPLKEGPTVLTIESAGQDQIKRTYELPIVVLKSTLTEELDRKIFDKFKGLGYKFFDKGEQISLSLSTNLTAIFDNPLEIVDKLNDTALSSLNKLWAGLDYDNNGKFEFQDFVELANFVKNELLDLDQVVNYLINSAWSDESASMAMSTVISMIVDETVITPDSDYGVKKFGDISLTNLLATLTGRIISESDGELYFKNTVRNMLEYADVPRVKVYTDSLNEDVAFVRPSQRRSLYNIVAFKITLEMIDSLQEVGQYAEKILPDFLEPLKLWDPIEAYADTPLKTYLLEHMWTKNKSAYLMHVRLLKKYKEKINLGDDNYDIIFSEVINDNVSDYYDLGVLFAGNIPKTELNEFLRDEYIWYFTKPFEDLPENVTTRFSENVEDFYRGLNDISLLSLDTVELLIEESTVGRSTFMSVLDKEDYQEVTATLDKQMELLDLVGPIGASVQLPRAGAMLAKEAGRVPISYKGSAALTEVGRVIQTLGRRGRERIIYKPKTVGESKTIVEKSGIYATKLRKITDKAIVKLRGEQTTYKSLKVYGKDGRPPGINPGKVKNPGGLLRKFIRWPTWKAITVGAFTVGMLDFVIWARGMVLGDLPNQRVSSLNQKKYDIFSVLKNINSLLIDLNRAEFEENLNEKDFIYNSINELLASLIGDYEHPPLDLDSDGDLIWRTTDRLVMTKSKVGETRLNDVPCTIEGDIPEGFACMKFPEVNGGLIGNYLDELAASFGEISVPFNTITIPGTDKEVGAPVVFGFSTIQTLLNNKEYFQELANIMVSWLKHIYEVIYMDRYGTILYPWILENVSIKSVSDGDTVTVQLPKGFKLDFPDTIELENAGEVTVPSWLPALALNPDNEYDVRLLGYDSAEYSISEQNFGGGLEFEVGTNSGKIATEGLVRLLGFEDEEATVVLYMDAEHPLDQFGRLLGVISLKPIDINSKQDSINISMLRECFGVPFFPGRNKWIDQEEYKNAYKEAECGKITTTRNRAKVKVTSEPTDAQIMINGPRSTNALGPMEPMARYTPATLDLECPFKEEDVTEHVITPEEEKNYIIAQYGEDPTPEQIIKWRNENPKRLAGQIIKFPVKDAGKKYAWYRIGARSKPIVKGIDKEKWPWNAERIQVFAGETYEIKLDIPLG